jgi:hypothetical protein
MDGDHMKQKCCQKWHSCCVRSHEFVPSAYGQCLSLCQGHL